MNKALSLELKHILYWTTQTAWGFEDKKNHEKFCTVENCPLLPEKTKITGN